MVPHGNEPGKGTLDTDSRVTGTRLFSRLGKKEQFQTKLLINSKHAKMMSHLMIVFRSFPSGIWSSSCCCYNGNYSVKDFTQNFPQLSRSPFKFVWQNKD